MNNNHGAKFLLTTEMEGDELLKVRKQAHIELCVSDDTRNASNFTADIVPV